MAFWDRVSDGMRNFADQLDRLNSKNPDPFAPTGTPGLPDDGFSVQDKDYCWEDLDFQGNYTLQRHVVSGCCRIIDHHGTIVDSGSQAAMEASMQRREGHPNGMGGGGFPANPVRAQYGDIIGVVRKNGAYEHYGIYISDTCVIHYAVPASTPVAPASVHCTSLRYFLRDDTEYFVLDFPQFGQPPVRIGTEPAAFPVNHGTLDPQDAANRLAEELQRNYGYHLYSPEETVARAKTRIGEAKYNLLTNNCEHFVIWCKTGVSESMQVNGLLHSLTGANGWQFHRPFHW